MNYEALDEALEYIEYESVDEAVEYENLSSEDKKHVDDTVEFLEKMGDAVIKFNQSKKDDKKLGRVKFYFPKNKETLRKKILNRYRNKFTKWWFGKDVKICHGTKKCLNEFYQANSSLINSYCNKYDLVCKIATDSVTYGFIPVYVKSYLVLRRYR